MASNVNTMFMCDDCGKVFQTIEIFHKHVCKGSTNRSGSPSGQLPIASTVMSAETAVEKNNHKSEHRITMFQCERYYKWFDNMQIFVNHECQDIVDGEAHDDHVSSDQSNIEQDLNSGTAWTRSPTLCLIKKYNEMKPAMENGRIRKSQVWAKISETLRQHGYTFTETQVNGRWKTLMRLYKNVKDGNKKSGSGRKDFPYYEELDAILGSDPAITPRATMTSSISSTASSTESSTASSTASSGKRTERKRNELDDSEEDTDISSKSITGNRNQQKRRKSQASEVVDFMEKYVNRQEENIKRTETKENKCMMKKLK